MSAASYAFAFVVLLSVLIFVHELGHFVVAKLCGVRVLKFSLGFGPPIGIGRFRLAWTRGHTEYVVGCLPLGGFVKMLGEDPGEEESGEAGQPPADPEETLQAKPLWQKLSIVFAGPAMNLLFAVALFVLMLFVGLQNRDAVIGTVEASSPAAAAGLEPGDRVVALDGEAVRWWSDVLEIVRARAGERVEVLYRRDGGTATAVLEIGERPGFDEFGTVQAAGWAGFDHPRLRALLGIPGARAPARAAGLRSGDAVVAVDGRPVEDWSGFARAYAAAHGEGVEIQVERGAERESVRVDVPALGSARALGVVPATVLVAAVSPESPADRAGLEPGDLILSVDGEPMGSFMAFSDAVKTSGGRTLDLRVARGGEARSLSVTPELAPLDMGLGVEDHFLVGISSQPTTLPGAMAQDRVRNPLVAVPRAASMTWDMAATIVRGVGKLVTGEVSRKQIAGPIGIAQIAGSALQLGWETYLQVMIFISINLGILNLLPIPILDGGQAVVFSIEGIKRAPLSLRTRENFQKVGLTVLVLLMGLAFWNDISRHWAEVLDWLRRGTGL